MAQPMRMSSSPDSGHSSSQRFTDHASRVTVCRVTVPLPSSLFPIHHSPFTIHHSRFTNHCSLPPSTCRGDLMAGYGYGVLSAHEVEEDDDALLAVGSLEYGVVAGERAVQDTDLVTLLEQSAVDYLAA